MAQSDAFPVDRIARLSEIIAGRDAILCDVWGVVHNGVNYWKPACDALREARANGLVVVLITNSPRPNAGVRAQLRKIGVPDDCYDDVVTSGDVTRGLIDEGPRQAFHIGPDHDLPIFDGLDVELVEERDAAIVVCTGLFDDENETPDDYADILRRIRSRNLPFICANPDIVVERGDRLIWCAGSIAREYGQMGGRTLIAGKPHRPIYERALAIINQLTGKEIPLSRILAIGDGLTTDVKGAMQADIPFIFISDGIHAREYGEPGHPDMHKMAAFLDEFGAKPAAVMTKLA